MCRCCSRRNPRYIGDHKCQLQRLWIAGAVNLKQLSYPSTLHQADLDACFAALTPR